MAGRLDGNRTVPAWRGSARAALLSAVLVALSACSVSDVMSPRPEIDVGFSTAAVPVARIAPAPSAPVPTRGMQALVPSNPMMVAYPRFTPPQDPAAAAVMPAEEVACRRRLKRLGVTYRDLAPINDGGACRVDWPVEVSGLSGGIAMSPAATLNCQMAETFARWTKNELAPAARTRYLTGIGKIRQGSSYSCRKIAGTSVASEHSKGNALDVMSIELKNGREVDVRKPGFFAFRQRGLLNSVRAEGCDYFTTVLGPGYNYDHRDHFHFDLKGRRNGYRACK
ncbi:extensin family protein [Nitratireductor pacificus]|uniref:Extensin-like protein n=1 Tax=Nitratireductor pacificus pht-3B TaxID=391937 RepID=K2LJX9_9HYPH|nr:extensin family protein [Nitratireductor pacificus]EKF18049.1 extensin-like protein [Nitratireductor pacificus pht-3B]